MITPNEDIGVQPDAAIEAPPTFRFVEFNPRRKARNVEAARVEVKYVDGEKELLWMSRDDIQNNLTEFGQDGELLKALAAYTG